MNRQMKDNDPETQFFFNLADYNAKKLNVQLYISTYNL